MTYSAGSAAKTTWRAAMGFNTLYGGRQNDHLIGGSDPNLLYGGPGADQLQAGRSHDDALLGGPGPDQMRGGAGDDLYTGGTGRDRMIDLAGGDDSFDGGHDRDYDVARAGPGIFDGASGSPTPTAARSSTSAADDWRARPCCRHSRSPRAGHGWVRPCRLARGAIRSARTHL